MILFRKKIISLSLAILVLLSANLSVTAEVNNDSIQSHALVDTQSENRVSQYINEAMSNYIVASGLNDLDLYELTDSIPIFF